MTCPSLSPGDPFLSGVLGYVDCQAQILGSSGYKALAASGSTGSIGLSVALTIFVALFGYRMLFGQLPGVRDASMAAVKVGFVMALATSWPTFRTLAYDTALHGPAHLAAEIGGAAALPGANGGLIARLQGVDDALVELYTLGAGRPPVVGPDLTVPAGGDPQPQQQRLLQRLREQPRWDPTHDAQLLGQARMAYLTTAIGTFASVRIVAALLLALGPIFVLFLLFDATRGLFEAWLRALIGAALGALSTAIVLGVELGLAEPWLSNILAQRRADIATLTVPAELVVVTWAFGLTALAALIASAWVAQGLRIPAALSHATQWVGTRVAHHADNDAATTDTGAERPPEARSRVRSIADWTAATERRESNGPSLPVVHLVERGAGQGARPQDIATTREMPVAQSTRRRTTTRVSAGSNRRDAS